MASPPWFPFWVNDFFEDPHVKRMDLEEIGAYMKLLAVSWKEEIPGSLPKDLRKLCRISGISLRKLRRFFAKELGKCWIDNGELLVNPRLVQEAEKQHVIIQKRKSSGSLGGLAKARNLLEKSSSKCSSKPLVSYSQILDLTPPTLLQIQSESLTQQVDPLAEAVKGNGHPPAVWPEEFLDVKKTLEELGVLDAFDDPPYWKRIELLTADYKLGYVDEIAKYIHWWNDQPPSVRHKNKKKGFSRWIRRAINYEENRRG